VVRAARSDGGGVVTSLGGGLMGHVRVFGCRSGMASARLEGAGGDSDPAAGGSEGDGLSETWGGGRQRQDESNSKTMIVILFKRSKELKKIILHISRQ
jgi:hypothetical protein